MTTQTIDPEKVGAFAHRLVGAIQGAALVQFCSIGHQAGLFETLSTLPPSTSAEIAAAAGLHERYVREWLGGMVSGGLVEYDPERGAYRLPPEHAACLTRAAGPGNLAVGMQFIPMLADTEERIVDCFRNGGGLPYSAYPRFHRVMADNSASIHDSALVRGILPLVEGLPARLEAGIDVLDVGCGSGHAVNLMAQAFPNSRFTGYDFSESAIAAARGEASALGLTNASFELRDVSVLAIENGFHLITAFDAIHDQAHPAQVLAGIHHALRPGGTFLMVDLRASSQLEGNLANPMAPAFYLTSLMHCMPVSLGLGGAGLGTMWGEQVACAMLNEAGFTSVRVRTADGDPFNNYYITTKE